MIVGIVFIRREFWRLIQTLLMPQNSIWCEKGSLPWKRFPHSPLCRRGPSTRINTPNHDDKSTPIMASPYPRYCKCFTPSIVVRYTVRIQNKVIHFQRPIVLMSINLNICMCHIRKEQLIVFPLVPFLHHGCQVWPSTLPFKTTTSFSTFCKFCDLDKRVIAMSNSAFVWLQRLSHLMQGDHFPS